MNNELIGKHKTEVDTPALLLDMDAVERNITRMAAFFAGRDCKLRPHFKTHKLPIIARKQMESGAVGITCATVNEAEILLRSGLKEVLIANEVVRGSKIRRMLELADLGNLIVCVDNYENARDISRAAASCGGKMDVLVEVNVGLDRCGVGPGKPALELAEKVSSLENANFRGLMGYEGGLFIDARDKEGKCRECNSLLVETSRLLRDSGLPVEIVSAGGSNTYCLTGVYPGITEIQPGSYVTMDSFNASHGLDFEQAITVIATVISRPEKDRAIIDAGIKAISTDHGLPSLTQPGLELYALNEEHGRVSVKDPGRDLAVGDKIEIAPSHGCTTIGLYRSYVLIRGEYVEGTADISGR